MEEGLAKARAAIQEAIRSKNYTSHKKETFIPKGSVYWNSHAFHQLSLQGSFKSLLLNVRHCTSRIFLDMVLVPHSIDKHRLKYLYGYKIRKLLKDKLKFFFIFSSLLGKAGTIDHLLPDCLSVH